MDELDRKMKDCLENRNSSRKYQQMIDSTMRMIENGEIRKEKAQVRSFGKKSKMIRVFQGIAACLVVGVLSVTAYAGATGKISINIGNTGHKKIDKNYNDVATSVDKKVDNAYFTLSLESMAADPAYLIFEYDIKLKDTAMSEIGEVHFENGDGYGIELDSDTFINGQEKILIGGRNLRSIERVSEKEFRLVEIYSIANIPENTLQVSKRLKNLVVYRSEDRQIGLNVDISEVLTADVKFENREPKVLAEAELSNGATLYIEDVSNSKFENFILARTVSQTKKYGDFWSKESQFMFEDYVDFAICDQDGKTINHDADRLDEYFEKLQEDGSYLVQPSYGDENYFEITDEDLVRRQEVQLLKLAIDDESELEEIQILPVGRKLYNDRNRSEYDFYMQEDWYPVQLGDVAICETSQIGGSVTVTRIEENEEEIIFVYEKEGYVPSDIDFAVRVKSKQMNYRYPRYIELSGIDGVENRIVFTKDVAMLSGMPLLGYDRMDNLDELEFAMFYNVKYDILADALKFDWDENESDNVAEITNIAFTEFVNSINEKLNSIHGVPYYEGVITEVNEKALKFYSENNKKELILENPSEFEYINRKDE